MCQMPSGSIYRISLSLSYQHIYEFKEFHGFFPYGLCDHVPFSHCGQASPGSKKIVGVFYKANEYAALNPNFVGCVEGALGIRDWLESQGHQYIVTDDKEGPNSGLCIVR